MASRQLPFEGKTGFEPTRITTRKSYEPRDEKPKLPKSAHRNRPTPIDTTAQEDGFTIGFNSLQLASAATCRTPPEPEIVDIASSNKWPRRIPNSRRTSAKRLASSSTASEMSLGILDYYLTAPSPPPSPTFVQDTQRLEIAVTDQAVENFNFELTPATASPAHSRMSNKKIGSQAASETQAGAEDTWESLFDSSPCFSLSRPSNERKDTYSLFPNIEVTTPTRKPTTNALDFQPTQNTTPKSTITIVPPHQQPDSSYRPRKESVSSSVRSRKDSFTSFCGTRRIPMRVLSSCPTPTPTAASTASNSVSTASPPQQSRWSNDTVTSPGVATTSGPRASFGPLLGRDSVTYPACFFEDDDEDNFGCYATPRRRKFRWQRWSKSTMESKTKRMGRFDERRSLGAKFARLVLCGCCGSGR